ncbi:hypothetical protein N7366_22570 [Aeromonas caviae]|nr:hypothetical protein [Aeromonas caviae]MDH0435962.1 hypothetical protein [Aeromonas caviae]MDH0938808.1 hypothetical protein [Aeromonas caviae]MDH1399641.1 hypothetical protein [Aeromonas caviae]MDH1806753.1 hypothetical protein [Aeromonas caviae]
MTGVEAVNNALNPIGVNVVTVDIPEAARPLLEASHRRALTKAEHGALIAAFNLSQGELLEQARLAGRAPAVQGGGVATEETGVGPYPKVYDLMALDERTRSAVLGKYGSSRDPGKVEVDRQGAGKLAVSKHTTTITLLSPCIILILPPSGQVIPSSPKRFLPTITPCLPLSLAPTSCPVVADACNPRH